MIQMRPKTKRAIKLPRFGPFFLMTESSLTVQKCPKMDTFIRSWFKNMYQKGVQDWTGPNWEPISGQKIRIFVFWASCQYARFRTPNTQNSLSRPCFEGPNDPNPTPQKNRGFGGGRIWPSEGSIASGGTPVRAGYQ